VANIGVHGKPATLHLEKLWIRDVTITTGLVDTNTIPSLLKLIEAGKLAPERLISHRFSLTDAMGAYDAFADAAATDAMKVAMHAS
jgi:alcohol dehydrogenase